VKIIATHTATNQEVPIRLQEYGLGIFLQVGSKSALKKVLKKELILVNDIVATTATFIEGGEVLTLLAQEEKTSERVFNCALDVLYEDNFIAIINKPAGILVSGNGFKTIKNALEQNTTRSTALDAVAPQPVHRLDYATTGVLVVGKTSAAISKLNQLFEAKEVTKIYRAITIGAMEMKGTLELPIDGKEAHTSFKVLATVPSKRFKRLNLVELLPSTGRRHQLRKHLASIGNPILGDVAYSKEGLLLKGKGLYLHAYSIAFEHPITLNLIEVAQPLPHKYKKIFIEL